MAQPQQLLRSQQPQQLQPHEAQKPQPAQQHTECEQLQRAARMQRGARAARALAIDCVARLRIRADSCGLSRSDAALTSLEQQAGVPLQLRLGDSIIPVPEITSANAAHIAAAAVAAVKQALEMASDLEAHVAASERRNARVCVQRWLKIMHDFACALCEMETLGWVHCDVKPDNLFIMMDERAEVGKVREWHGRLGDFGLSMPVAATKMHRWGCGTRGFRAPETAKDSINGVKQDVWGLGVCGVAWWNGADTTLDMEKPCAPPLLRCRSVQCVRRRRNLIGTLPGKVACPRHV